MLGHLYSSCPKFPKIDVSKQTHQYQNKTYEVLFGGFYYLRAIEWSYSRSTDRSSLISGWTQSACEERACKDRCWDGRFVALRNKMVLYLFDSNIRFKIFLEFRHWIVKYSSVGNIFQLRSNCQERSSLTHQDCWKIYGSFWF